MKLSAIAVGCMLIFACVLPLGAQHTIEGVIMEEGSNGAFTPLEYVHVRSLEEDVGTYTDSTGYFKLELTEPDTTELFHSDIIVVTFPKHDRFFTAS